MIRTFRSQQQQRKAALATICLLGRRTTGVLAALAILAVVNLGLSTWGARAHNDLNRNYAVIYESSVGAYRGAIGSIDFSDPALGSGILTSANIWAADRDTCGGAAWVEAGWAKSTQFFGQARYLFAYKVAPSCVFQIYQNIGSPALGYFTEYRLVYYTPTNKWRLYVNGTYKAQVSTSFVFADYLTVGGEVGPVQNGTVKMGPTHSQSLQYQTSAGAWVSFYYQDAFHCDIDPPLQPYNLIHPGGVPDWIYVWGPAAGGYCG